MILYKNISELLTLAPAAKKSGRRIAEFDLGIVEDAALVASGTRILWAGKLKEIPKKLLKGKRKSISLNGKVVMPGFVECHTHSLFGGNRAHEFEMRNQGATYQEIASKGGGILSTVRATRAASDRDLMVSLNKHVLEFVRQGVTTLEVKSGYGLNHKEEIRLLSLINKVKKIRVVSTYLGPHARSPEQPDFSLYIDEIIKKTLPEIKQKKLSRRVDIFVEHGYFSLELGERYWQAAKSLEMDLVGHVEQLTATGAAVAAAKMNAVSVDHLVCLKDDEVGEIAGSETTCVLLPTADFYLKMAYPAARRLIDAGARVALATDFNPGTSPSTDLSLVGVLARLNMKMTLPEIISAYTIGAAHALRLADSVGSLEAGKSADFIVLENSWRELFYRVGKMPILSTWSKNKRIY
ncbi:MAG: imidazolonepropionase [Proteobacteria bacterium SG_bin7]|nr:MAG: imidazolonepropionase [Proteobacteria bacterium SG_bin7]